ncbi:plasma membrane localization protein [Coemansia sp. RSA 2610]|nr:plasma membrane localization protein [Coemansia sp. RSA 2610]
MRTYAGLELPHKPPSALEEDRAGASQCLPHCLPCLRLQLSTSAHAPSDFILFHPVFRRYVKHASLVERCFPAERTDGAAPSSNELSYLVYYVQSKPAKLTKVGAYLSKRIAKDVQRRRRADVAVGLQIYDALLDACGRDLNFFARDVLGTLDSVLAADDAGLAAAATATFVRFCSAHTGATLPIDKDLCSLYSLLIRTFVAYMHEQPARAALGLCAVQAVAESRATYADDCYYELPLVAAAVAARIGAAPRLESPAPADSIEDQLAALAAGAQPSDAQLGQRAWHCVSTLVRRAHGQHAHIVVSEIFRHLDSGLEWQPVSRCVRIVTAVVGQLQPQDQNMVIVETLALLTDGTFSTSPLYLERTDAAAASKQPASADDACRERKASSRRACVIRILERLFCKPYVLVGISVMEALNVLVTYLLESVDSTQLAGPDQAMFAAALSTATSDDDGRGDGEDTEPAVPDAGGASGSTVHPDHMSDYYHLLAAIGGLAKHQYYGDQLSDMAAYLVSQMRLAGAEASAATERQLWLLQALYIVLRANRLSTAAAAPSQEPLALPLAAAAPLFTLLAHESADCCALAADCICEALRSTAFAGADRGRALPADPELVAAAYSKLGQALRSMHTQPQQFQAAGYAGTAAIACELLRTLGTRGVPPTLALVDGCAPDAGAGAWLTLLAMVWAQVAAQHLNSDLETHVSRVAGKARAHGLWERRIEHVCLQRLRAAEVGGSASPSLASLPAGDTAEAGQGVAAAGQLLDQLHSSVVLGLLGPRVAASYSGGAAAAVPDSDAADQVLCQAGCAGAGCARNAVDQVKDIRARVSVDWDVHVRRDSIVAPHINVEQLRAALRDGLAVHAAEGDRGPAPLRTSATGAAAHSRDVIDTLAPASDSDDSDAGAGARAPPMPAEVRDLLDSIDDVGDAHAAGRPLAESRSTPGISTPVIGDV